MPLLRLPVFTLSIAALWVLLVHPLPAEEEPEPIVHFPRMRLRGHLQFQVDDGGLKSGRPGRNRPVRNGVGIFPTATRLSPRRLRLKPRLDFSEQVSLVNQVDLDADGFEQEDLRFTVLDLFARYEFAPGHELRLGQTKVPFGFENHRSSERISTIERSDVTRQLFQRDIGVAAYGVRGKLEYGVGVFQGQGSNNQDRNGTQDVLARLVYRITPEFEFGASGHIGAFRPVNARSDFKVSRLGVEARYRKGPFRCEGEYIVADGYNLFSKEETPSQGYYLYAIYEIDPDVELVAGYDRYDPDTSARGSVRSNNSVNARDRWTLGANYYPTESRTHRIMLNYEVRSELEGPGTDSNGIRVRYQYAW